MSKKVENTENLFPGMTPKDKQKGYELLCGIDEAQSALTKMKKKTLEGVLQAPEFGEAFLALTRLAAQIEKRKSNR